MLIKNMGKDFSLVTDGNDSPFAYNHEKDGFLIQDEKDERVVVVFPISEDGIVQYELAVEKRRNEIRPRFVKIVEQ